MGGMLTNYIQFTRDTKREASSNKSRYGRIVIQELNVKGGITNPTRIRILSRIKILTNCNIFKQKYNIILTIADHCQFLLLITLN